MSLHSPCAVTALPGYKIWVRYPDGVEGAVDLSPLVGQGVFRRWQDDPASFEGVKIANDGVLEWAGEIDLCADALYLEISGKSVDEVFPRLRQEVIHA
jgi:hypothetical protein